MGNRLAAESSPYLLLHAHNPVDWYPWGEEAFEKARTEDRPIFLSVGYSTCYWCHVMERESFENAEIARGEWGHPEHLIVAYFYALDGDMQEALTRMKNGIFRLLEAFGVDRSIEDPYPETMTVFWMYEVFSFTERNKDLGPVEACRKLVDQLDKDYPLRFYSRERLFSEDARKRYVRPDLAALSTTMPSAIT